MISEADAAKFAKAEKKSVFLSLVIGAGGRETEYRYNFCMRSDLC